MTTPTPEETVQVALSGAGGAVKTLTDIRFEKLEARFDALEKENAELRKANAELYAFAQAKADVPAQPQPQAQTQPQTAPAAAQAVEGPEAKVQAEQTERSILDNALAALGYRRTEDNSGM